MAEYDETLDDSEDPSYVEDYAAALERLRQKKAAAQAMSQGNEMSPLGKALTALASGYAGGLLKKDGGDIYRQNMATRQAAAANQAKLAALDVGDEMKGLAALTNLRAAAEKTRNLATTREKERKSEREFRTSERLAGEAAALKRAGITSGAKSAKESAADETNLRKEITGLSTSKDMREVASAYEKIKAAAKVPSAAGDMSLIYGFMKMEDPESSVKEGEFASAANSGSISDKAIAAYNKVLSGQRLSPEQRADFLKQSGNMFNAQVTAYKRNIDFYETLAKKKNIDPSLLGPTYNPVQLGPSDSAGSVVVSKGSQRLRIPVSDLASAEAEGFKRTN